MIKKNRDYNDSEIKPKGYVKRTANETQVTISYAEELWVSYFGTFDRKRKKYFNYLTVVLNSDKDKIKFFIDSLSEFYHYLCDRFDLPAERTPEIITQKLIDFVLDGYRAGMGVTDSNLAYKASKKEAFEVEQAEQIREIEFKIEHDFETIGDKEIDKAQFENEQEFEIAKRIIKITTF